MQKSPFYEFRQRPGGGPANPVAFLPSDLLRTAISHRAADPVLLPSPDASGAKPVSDHPGLLRGRPACNGPSQNSHRSRSPGEVRLTRRQCRPAATARVRVVDKLPVEIYSPIPSLPARPGLSSI